MLTIGQLSTICNGNTFSDMSLSGATHEKEVKEFLEMPYGIPPHDTFEEVFAKPEAEALMVLFSIWIKDLQKELKNAGISIDGKSIRRSRGKNQNVNILRKQALQLMKRETSSKLSMRQKWLRCSYDFSYAFKVLGFC